MSGRVPRKQDFQYNFAISGATCEQVSGAWQRQAPRLASIIKREPGRWSDGVVVVRIGVNSFGQPAHLDRLAKDRNDPAMTSVIQSCVGHVAEAHRVLRDAHPDVRIVLVGIFDNTNWARQLSRYRDPTQLGNISAALDVFDNGLRDIASRESKTIFFDDRAWFRDTWGSRDGAGIPAYRAVGFGTGVQVTNTEGDHPRNATLLDSHAGTAWNTMWADALIALLNERFSAGIPRLEPEEMLQLVAPTGLGGFE
jgi:hypothetical protein